MKLIGYEFIKVLRKKFFLVIIVTLVLVNGYLYYQEEIKYNDFLINSIDDYYLLENIYKDMPSQQALKEILQLKDELSAFTFLSDYQLDKENQFIQLKVDEIKTNNPELIKKFTNSKYMHDSNLLRKHSVYVDLIYSQLAAIDEYKDYVEGIKERADNMLSVSIFQDEGTFSYRNILKTPSDFEHLKNIKLSIGLDNSVVTATQYPITDIIIIIVIFLLCNYIFWREKEDGLIGLIRTNKKGRFHVITAKLVTLISITALLALVFYGSIILVAKYLYGFSDMSRYIQSIADFRQCNLLITVKQYLYLFLISKILVCILLSLIFSLIFTLFNHASKIYLFLTALLGLSYIFYLFIQPQSYFNPFKYINIFAFLNTFSVLGEYKNINFFGYPVCYIWVYATSIAVFFIVFPLITIRSYVKHYSVASRILFSGLWSKIKEKVFRPTQSVSLLNQELFKVFCTGKSSVVFLIALIIAYNGIIFKEVRFNKDDAMYNSYLNKISGQMDEEKINFIETEKLKFDGLHSEYAKICSAYLEKNISLEEFNEKRSELEVFAEKKKAFDRVYAQYDYLLKLKQERGIHGSFINQISTSYLFENNLRNILNSFIYTILLLLCVCTIFPIDYKDGMISILKCSKNGRTKLFVYKHIISYIIAFVLMIIIYIPQYINLLNNYNMDDWSAPVQSIIIFKNINISISIIEFVIITNLLQLLGAIIISQCILFISLILKKQSIAIIVSIAAFVFPILAQLSGLEYIRDYSFNGNFMLFSVFAESDLIQKVILYYCVLICIGAGTSFLSWNKYNNNLPIAGVKRNGTFH